MASEEKWEDIEEPNTLKKILNKVFPPKKSKVKNKNKQEPSIDTNKVETKETIQEIQPEPKPIEIQQKKKKKKPLFSLRPPKSKKVDSEDWEKDTPNKKPFIPKLDNQVPITMVLKRIIATILLLANLIGLIYGGSQNTYSTIVLLLVTLILLDYLSITGSYKKESWEE